MEYAEYSLKLSPCMRVYLQSDIFVGDRTFAGSYFAMGLNVLQGWRHLLDPLAKKQA